MIRFRPNDFLSEHRYLAKQLYHHYELSGLLATVNLEQGEYESASRNLDNQQDDLHELIQLKKLKKKRDYHEQQEHLHNLLRQQQISFSVVRKPKKY